jgi:motility quorum-sensing regulator/GCU-specific mRNA interferase toxin
MEKHKPHYNLETIKFVAADINKLEITISAMQGAASLGFGRDDVVRIIQTILSKHFYKSMTSYSDSSAWQDVYRVPSEVGTLYIKFTSGIITEFLLLSFKEK